MTTLSLTELTQKCREPFPDSDILADKQRPDGFRPNYIPWDKITKRLDDVFGGLWEFQIIKYEFVGNQAIVNGRLTVRNGSGFLHKDGIGCATLTMTNGQATQMGDDLKSAASDALKRAAVLLGIGVQLYDRDAQVRNLATQAQQATQESMDGPATAADVSAIRTMLQRFQYPENLACDYLKVPNVESIQRLTAVQLLSGQHPLTMWLNEQANVRAGQPQGGLRASNA